MAFSFFSTGANSEVNFIPEVFSKLLQSKFYSASVMPAISNTDYQGEISGQGDKVTIRTVCNNQRLRRYSVKPRFDHWHC